MTSPSFSPWLCGLAWGVFAAGSVASAGEESTAGVVRISKPAGTAAVVRAQSDGIQQVGCKECEQGYAYDGYHSHSAGHFHGGYGLGLKGRLGHGDYYCDACNGWHDGFGGCNKNRAIIEYFKCKFGYFIPTGNGGAGTPPFGKYARVYPNDPSYFDQRDGQVYGAAGYGVPVSVPLAPVVSHQYNYSWGTPSSRLTPVSRIAPY